MTRVVVQRGSTGSSSNATRPASSSAPQQHAAAGSKEDEHEKEVLQEPIAQGEHVECGSSESRTVKNDDVLLESSHGISNTDESTDKEKSSSDSSSSAVSMTRELSGLQLDRVDSVGSSGVGLSQTVTGVSYPPPPPVPPPKPSAVSTNARTTIWGGSTARIGCARRPPTWSGVSSRSSPSGSRPTSPRSFGEGEGYNSSDEHGSCYVSSYDDAEQERLFELDIRRTRGFEVKKMLEDGNCLFRAVADQVYGDPEAYDMVRQMCIDYMESERDHFSQFITEGFTSYCKRKRRDKVYGNNVEIQAFAEMYNCPIHIYSYSTEPINIFHGSYDTDTPVRLSFHHGNHYNSLVDPHRLTIGAGLGFSSLQGTNVDRDQVKAVIKAQQDQQIDNALLAEGRFYSDLELTEKEMERMVMLASRAEYLAEDKLKQQRRESSTSGAEPSSSGATTGSSHFILEGGRDKSVQPDMVLSSSMQTLLSMGFSYLQVVGAYSIFGDDVDSMVCYLLEMGGSGASSGGTSRSKGKAAE